MEKWIVTLPPGTWRLWSVSLFPPLAILPLALFLLAGCTTQGDGGTAASRLSAGQAPPGFACPPAGTVVILSDDTITFRGADPNDATVCVSDRANGDVRRLIYGFYNAGGLSDTEVQAGMAPLFPLAVGRRASFIRTVPNRRVGSSQFLETHRIAREETIRVGDVEVDTWVMDRVQDSITSFEFGALNYRGEDTHWIDKISGAYVRRVVVSPFGPTYRGFSAIALHRAQ